MIAFICQDAKLKRFSVLLGSLLIQRVSRNLYYKILSETVAMLEKFFRKFLDFYATSFKLIFLLQDEREGVVGMFEISTVWL